MPGTDAAKADGTALFRHLVMKVHGLKHRFRLIGPRFGRQSPLQFSLVLSQDLVVFFLHSKRAPLWVL
jgi:hypothetical protein